MTPGRVVLTFLLPLTSLAQINENFSDGNFSSEPAWSGDAESFVINSEQHLQLDANEPGIVYLSTPSFTNIDASWEFEVQMSFNPSAQNFCRIYLISDSQHLSGMLNGYYVSVGGISDEVSLFRQDLLSHVKILEGESGFTNTTTVKISVKVTRDSHYNWNLYAKSANDQSYTLMGTANDGIHQKANYFGFYCQFTTTRSRGFFLDDIRVEGTSYVDIDPPQLLSLNAVENNKLEIHINEPIITPHPNQISIIDGGHPAEVLLKTFGIWELTFDLQFEPGVEYSLELNNIQDPHGNSLSLFERFQYYKPVPVQAHDVVITEIMADPSPPLQLPEVEYIELYNRSGNAVSLLNWSISDAAKAFQLPDILLLPGQYLVLSSISDTNFPNGPDHQKMNSWPALNNDSDLISLVDTSGNTIHFVDYSDEWYGNNLKKHGGWSLEMIDVNYPCSGKSNWTASTSFAGGTPGFVNSVTTDNPDLTPLEVIKTYASNPYTLHIYFDQLLLPDLGAQPEVSLKPIIAVDTFYLPSPKVPELKVLLRDSLKIGTIYQITAFGLADCNQNINFEMGAGSNIGLEQPADSGDLIINEILFNPKPLGVRFIELYNRSVKPVNLKDWRFAIYQSGSLSDHNPIAEDHLMIYPGDYLVFTENPDKLKSQYQLSPLSTLIKVKKLPSLSNKQGSVALVAADGMVIDNLNYHENMHHSLLINVEGVSLERADSESAASDPGNWYSGSERSGYASPGLKNSQTLMTSESDFSVVPEIISPMSSLYPSYAQISFRMEQPGNSGSLVIYNQRGHLVKTLVNNSILPTDGVYQWDGSDDNGKRVPMGYYIILFQITGKNFGKNTWKETVVVSPDY